MRFVRYLAVLFLLLCSSIAFSQRFVRDDAGQIYYIDSTTADTVKIDVTGSVFKITNTGATFEMSSMTTVQRDALTASNGMIINNTTDGQIQGYANGVWVNLGAGAGGGETNTYSSLAGDETIIGTKAGAASGRWPRPSTVPTHPKPTPQRKLP